MKTFVTLNDSLDKIKEDAVQVKSDLDSLITNINKFQGLSNIDNMIFDMRQEGMSYRQIAEELDISMSTVRNKLRKMGLIEGR